MKLKFSYVLIFFVILFEFYLGFIYYPKFENTGTEASISWDVAGYYMYLPAIFIYKDIKACSFQDAIIKKYRPVPEFSQSAFKHASGNYVMKYASGQAIVFSPAFFVAHFYCVISKKFPADGFSYPYQLAISIWTFLLSIFGMIILRKVLSYYFEDHVVALSLLSIVLCSNYLEYAAISGGLTHNSLFTVYTLILLLTIRFYKDPGLFHAIGIAAFCALAALIRPTEIISLLIPLLWGLSAWSQIGERWKFLVLHKKKLAWAIMSFTLIGSIQSIYWKTVSGHFLVYSYQEQGFDWLKPHIINCLFSAEAGWWLYSPVFIFALAGIFLLRKNNKELFFPISIFLLVFTYLCFAWSEWWYGWSLGQRAMIQSYPLWAFGLAAFFRFLLSCRIYYRLLFIPVLVLFMLYNFWLVKNCHKGGMLRGPEMTMAYFIEILGKSKSDKAMLVLLDNKDFYRKAIKKTDTLYSNNFESEALSEVLIYDSMKQNKKIVLHQIYQSSAVYKLPMPAIKHAKWYRISADITCVSKEWATWDMPQFIVKFKKNDLTIKHNIVRITRLVEAGETKKIVVYSKPHRDDYDAITVEFNNMNNEKQIEIDNLLIEKIIE